MQLKWNNRKTCSLIIIIDFFSSTKSHDYNRKLGQLHVRLQHVNTLKLKFRKKTTVASQPFDPYILDHQLKHSLRNKMIES